MKIPSSIREERNVESIQQEVQEQPFVSNTEIIELENDEMDILDGEFQEGMISALRGVEDNLGDENNQEDEGIEQPTIPDLLRERMKVKAPIEIQQEDDTTNFLTRLEKVTIKKIAKKYSLIQKDDVGFRSVQVDVPKVDKAIEDITLGDYEITTINLGPTTKEQEVQELDDLVKRIKKRLEKEIGKKEEFKKEMSS